MKNTKVNYIGFEELAVSLMKKHEEMGFNAEGYPYHQSNDLAAKFLGLSKVKLKPYFLLETYQYFDHEDIYQTKDKWYVIAHPYDHAKTGNRLYPTGSVIEFKSVNSWYFTQTELVVISVPKTRKES